MKILVLCQYFYPEQFLINDIVPELVKKGHDVTVLTGCPNYPDGKIKKGYPKTDEYKGAKVVRAYEIGRSKGLILNYLSFLSSAKRKIKKLGRFDVVFTYLLSPVTMAAPVIAYKKKYPDVKTLMYCLDIWPESFNAHMPIGFVKKAVAAYSKKVYSAYDKIAVTSKPFIDYLNRVNGVDKEKLVYIPQHGVGDLSDKDLTSHNVVPHFLFAGNIGKGQTPDVILKALALVKGDYVMNFVGDGSRLEEMKKLCKELNLDEKVKFLGRKSYAEMETEYKKADALLLTLRGNNEVGNTLPGKFQTYLSTGKPILAAINGAAYDLIKETGCGDAVKAGDVKGFAQILQGFIDNPQKYDGVKEKARSYYKENFTLEIFMDRLERELKNL